MMLTAALERSLGGNGMRISLLQINLGSVVFLRSPIKTLCTECHGHHCPWCSWLFLVWSQLLPPTHWSSLTTPLLPASVLRDLSSWCFRLLMCTWLAPPHLPGLNPNVFCCPYFLPPQKNLSAAIKAFQLIDWMRPTHIVKNNVL